VLYVLQFMAIRHKIFLTASIGVTDAGCRPNSLVCTGKRLRSLIACDRGTYNLVSAVNIVPCSAVARLSSTHGDLCDIRRIGGASNM